MNNNSLNDEKFESLKDMMSERNFSEYYRENNYYDMSYDERREFRDHAKFHMRELNLSKKKHRNNQNSLMYKHKLQLAELERALSAESTAAINQLQDSTKNSRTNSKAVLELTDVLSRAADKAQTLREDLNSDLSDQINEADEIVEFLQQNADKISPRKIANTVRKTNQVVHSITEDADSKSEKKEKYVKFSEIARRYFERNLRTLTDRDAISILVTEDRIDAFIEVYCDKLAEATDSATDSYKQNLKETIIFELSELASMREYLHYHNDYNTTIASVDNIDLDSNEIREDMSLLEFTTKRAHIRQIKIAKKIDALKSEFDQINQQVEEHSHQYINCSLRSQFEAILYEKFDSKEFNDNERDFIISSLYEEYATKFSTDS